MPPQKSNHAVGMRHWNARHRIRNYAVPLHFQTTTTKTTAPRRRHQHQQQQLRTSTRTRTTAATACTPCYWPMCSFKLKRPRPRHHAALERCGPHAWRERACTRSFLSMLRLCSKFRESIRARVSGLSWNRTVHGIRASSLSFAEF